MLDLVTRTGRLAEDEARRYFAELLGALLYMHRQRRVPACHRDVKLDNMGLVRAPDGRLHVRLLDFGFADAYDPAPAARLTLSCGTLEYGMSLMLYVRVSVLERLWLAD